MGGVIILGGNNGLSRDVAALAITAETAIEQMTRAGFQENARKLLDKHFHFGNGNINACFSFCSGSDNEEYDQSHIPNAEFSWHFTKPRYDTHVFANRFEDDENPRPTISREEFEERQKIWRPMQGRVGEFGYTRVFRGRMRSTIHGDFTRRDSDIAWDGMNILPLAKDMVSEIEVIVRGRLTPVFGVGNFEIIPLFHGGAPADINKVRDDFKFSDWRLNVFLNGQNAERFALAENALSNGGWGRIETARALDDLRFLPPPRER